MTRHAVNFPSPVQFEPRNRFLWKPSLDRRAGCTPHVFALIAALSTIVTLSVQGCSQCLEGKVLYSFCDTSCLTGDDLSRTGIF